MAITIYCILATIALSPCVGLPPFTLLFARYSQPPIVQSTTKFKKTNAIISYCWAIVFVICIVALWIIPENNLWHALTPIAIIIGIGLPITIIGIRLLPEYIAEQRPFSSCRELFELMPHGICRRYAKRLNADVTIQFRLSGTEPIIGYLTIKRTKCKFSEGETSQPTVTINCDSQRWLDICNGNADAVKESVEGNYTTEGNPSILLHLHNLFQTKWKIEDPLYRSIPKELYKEYARLSPISIKKVVIFYSGQRSKAFSKTRFMAEHLAKGIATEGGEVELIQLSDKQIHHCTGCYTCWTKTPGKCVFKDDMPELWQKYLDADLAVFASPLYTFSVNSTMKAFMDRLIPILKPYMEFAPNSHICHPERYDKSFPTHTLIVSAGGFPNIEGNFEGLRTLFRQFASHSPRASMRGELLLPAAEMIAIPLFQDRKSEVATACIAIGQELVRNGCPSVQNMQRISNTGLSEQAFRHMANIFWSEMDNKKAYTTTMNQLEY